MLKPPVVLDLTTTPSSQFSPLSPKTVRELIEEARHRREDPMQSVGVDGHTLEECICVAKQSAANGILEDVSTPPAAFAYEFGMPPLHPCIPPVFSGKWLTRNGSRAIVSATPEGVNEERYEGKVEGLGGYVTWDKDGRALSQYDDQRVNTLDATYDLMEKVREGSGQ